MILMYILIEMRILQKIVKLNVKEEVYFFINLIKII
jgi:hypothetical protein